MNEAQDVYVPKPKPFALICDIDETLTVQFDVPIVVGCEVLRKLDRFRLSVHYITARPPETRTQTEQFLIDERLPGFKNLNLCPRWQGTRTFKAEQHARLAKEYRVLASIGDAEEEERAAAAVGIPFVRVNTSQPDEAWQQLATLLAEFMDAG